MKISNPFTSFGNLFSKFRHRKEAIPNWKNPDVIPREVLSKEELDALEKATIEELSPYTERPQALFYLHKYIDAKFSKNDFDVDSYFTKKQNQLDKLYAEGMSEVYANLTGYQELMREQQEVQERYFKAMKKLGAELNDDIVISLDDSAELSAEIKSLPVNLNWSK